MAFFGLGHDKAKPGFAQTTDPFAALEGGEDDTILEFEDTYDGLGDQLDETDDAFNDDTFGDEGSKPDFDFFGQTAKVADAMQEEQVRFSRQQVPTAAKKTGPQASPRGEVSAFSYNSQPSSKPARTGYEKYRDPETVPDIEVDASIWGLAPKKTQPPPQTQTSQYAQVQPAGSAPAPTSGRKILSLEEVEAEMKAHAKASHQPAGSTPTQKQDLTSPPPQAPAVHAASQGGWPQEFSHQMQPQLPRGPQQHIPQGPSSHSISIVQRQQQQHPLAGSQKGTPPVSGPGPFGPHQQQPRHHAAHIQQIHQHPAAAHGQPNLIHGQRKFPGVPTHPTHRPQGSFSGITLQQPTGGDAAQLEQDAKRAKRNHKIFLMSRDNGLMTPSDKNFVSRIQLQQLVAATGNPNEPGSDDIAEDFYFQVLTQIRGGQRQNPNQPLNNFAQTYLFQTGNRHLGMRRHGRIAENHMQRMEQQVQRAVEAAKTKPKNKQLVIEGSLGKISFSNAKTPKPLLTIKRTESSSSAQQKSHASAIDRKDVLRAIEQVYTTLMELEDLERKQPPQMPGENVASAQELAEYHETRMGVLDRLWTELKFHEPIGGSPIHPFIVFLSFPKGKKAIPRIFRLITDEQRKVMLTMIVVHLEQLDVVRNGVEPDAAARDAIELFSAAVMPSLFSFFNSADMTLAIGVMGIIIRNVNLEQISRSRIGVSFLTMILSRPEILKNSGETDEQGWQEWVRLYNTFFDRIEPCLPYIFPGTAHTGEDVHVWQFLAALGVGANLQQQQRLVIAVKDRVMQTVAVSKTLPASMASQRLANVNLFMRSIGLDVELLG